MTSIQNQICFQIEMKEEDWRKNYEMLAAAGRLYVLQKMSAKKDKK